MRLIDRVPWYSHKSLEIEGKKFATMGVFMQTLVYS